MNRGCVVSLAAGLVIAGAAIGNVAMRTRAAEGADPRASSYMQVTEEDFRTVLARMRAAKAGIEKRQQDLLVARYDLADRPVVGTTMSRGKPVQGGVRVKLPTGVTWTRSRRRAPTRSSSAAPSHRALCRYRTPIIPRAAWFFRSS